VALPLVVVLGTGAGCGDPRGTDPTPHAEITSPGGDVALVEKAEADLVLYVSNQSFDDEEVRLSVEVDGVTVVDGDFHVEDQHNWISFPLRLPRGAHEVSAEADSGASLDASFRVPGDATRYAILDHWGEGSSAELTWSFHRRPVGFA
jgi:hypothetical protein